MSGGGGRRRPPRPRRRLGVEQEAPQELGTLRVEPPLRARVRLRPPREAVVQVEDDQEHVLHRLQQVREIPFRVHPRRGHLVLRAHPGQAAVPRDAPADLVQRQADVGLRGEDVVGPLWLLPPLRQAVANQLLEPLVHFGPKFVAAGRCAAEAAVAVQGLDNLIHQRPGLAAQAFRQVAGSGRNRRLLGRGRLPAFLSLVVGVERQYQAEPTTGPVRVRRNFRELVAPRLDAVLFAVVRPSVENLVVALSGRFANSSRSRKRWAL